MQEEVSYGLQRWCPEVQLITETPLCKKAPLCLHRRNWLILFEELQFTTASEKLCSLIAVDLGARHVGLGLTGSCAGSGWMAETPSWVGWANTVGSDWTLPVDPRTRACWATLVQSEWFCCMGSPATSPLLCPRWLLVGRHMGPDPHRTGWVHPLAMPGVWNRWYKLW